MILKTWYPIIIFFLAGLGANAQGTFKKSYGAAGNEQAIKMDVLPDGSFAVCGHTSTGSNGGLDALVVKYAPDGSVVWSVSFGGAMDDYLTGIKRTSDGGFIVVGTTHQNGTLSDLLAAKIDLDGNVVWQRRFGRADIPEQGTGVCIVSDGFIFTGTTIFSLLPHLYYLKTDFTGNVLWGRRVLSGGGTPGEPVALNNNLVVIPADFTEDGFLLTINRNTGNVSGTIRMGSLNYEHKEALHHLKSTGNGFIASGYAWEPFGNTEPHPWLVKLNPAGGVVWAKSYNMPGWANADPTGDGGFIFGVYQPGVLEPQAIIVKTDATGEVQWSKTYAYPPGMSGTIRHVREAPGGGYIAIGYCSAGGNGTDLMVFKTDASGNLDGCCSEDLNIVAQVYYPPPNNPVMAIGAWNHTVATAFTGANLPFTTETYCGGPCCATYAGTLQPASKLLCPDEAASFVHNVNEVLDTDDILRFILFSDLADTLGSIVATSLTPQFTFAPPMSANTVYYMAAVAGNVLGGGLDPDDPCLHFSNAAEVVWRSPPTVAFNVANPDVCKGYCRIISVDFGGTPPFSLTYSTPAGSVTQTFPAASGIIEVCVPAGTPQGGWPVQAISVSDAHCECH